MENLEFEEVEDDDEFQFGKAACQGPIQPYRYEPEVRRVNDDDDDDDESDSEEEDNSTHVNLPVQGRCTEMLSKWLVDLY
jgi:hypothetical protein